MEARFVKINTRNARSFFGVPIKCHCMCLFQIAGYELWLAAEGLWTAKQGSVFNREIYMN